MSFRFYIFLVFLAIIFLFTPMWEGACIAIACLVCVCIPMATFNYKSWKKSQKRSKKSLSFAILSMEQQKNNFRIINSVFLKGPFRKFFKKLSIIFDATPIKSTFINQDTSSSSYDYQCVVVTNPAFRNHFTNIYHKD